MYRESSPTLISIPECNNATRNRNNVFKARGAAVLRAIKLGLARRYAGYENEADTVMTNSTWGPSIAQ
jgi:hypothetical protein